MIRDRAPDTGSLLASARAAWTSGRRDEAVRRWRMAAAAAPGDPAAYVNLAGSADADAPAVGWIERAASAVAVADPLVARNLGVLAQGRGQTDRALASLRRSLVLAPERGATVSVFARLTRDPVGSGDALRWSLRAAVADPGSVAGWLEALRRLVAAGREAEAAARAAAIPIPLDEWTTELLAVVVNLRVRVGGDAPALPAASALTLREPADPSFRIMRAVILRRARDFPAAEREARRAALLRPDWFDGVGSVATVLAHAERHEEAVRQFRHCIAANPRRRSEILENFGGSLVKAGDPDAERILREAVVRRPERPAGYMNLSTLAFQAGGLDAAARLGVAAVQSGRQLADARYNLASIRRHQGRLHDARRLLDEAVAFEDRPYFHFVRAMLELGDGDPEDGLRRYESRWEVENFSAARRLGPIPTLDLPVWRGEIRRDATLAVWGEQGIGDELWFAGYLGWAVERVGKVVLEVAASLVGLMERSFPGVRVLARGDPATEAAMAAADLQVPMGGILLPAGAGTAAVPTGYLRVDAEHSARLRARYTAGRPAARIIGVSWRSVKPLRGRSFEAPLDAWGAIFGLEDAVFVSLQYGDVAADARLVKDRFGVELIVDPEIDAYRDLDAFAAQMAATDVVVSIANSTVATAHALGRPVHVIARVTQDDWRYARGAETTRWLPTARCVWQAGGSDWSTPIGVLAGRLRREPV